jgi:hypothetical protein
MSEKINHPQHYGGDTTYEAIKVIEAWGLGFNLGNAAKYICRAGKKGDELEDLKKAQFYLNRQIANLEKARLVPLGSPECFEREPGDPTDLHKLLPKKKEGMWDKEI